MGKGTVYPKRSDHAAAAAADTADTVASGCRKRETRLSATASPTLLPIPWSGITGPG